MAGFEALNDRLTHQIDGKMNIRFEHSGRKIVVQVPREYVGGLRGLIHHEQFGFEVHADSAAATREDQMGIGTRQTPIKDTLRLLKTDASGRPVRFVVATYSEKNAKRVAWL